MRPSPTIPREHLRFAPEALDAVAVEHERLGGLLRDVTIELRIARAIIVAHAAGPQQRDNLVGGEAWSSQGSVDTSLGLSVRRFELIRAHSIEVAVPT